MAFVAALKILAKHYLPLSLGKSCAFVRTEKEILAEFVSLVFAQADQSEFDYLSKAYLMKASLPSVRLAANDAIEMSSLLKESEQDSLNSQLLNNGLPSLSSFQNKAFKGFLKIAERGNIKSNKEYELVRSLSETTILNQEHQNMAYELMDGYESART